MLPLILLLQLGAAQPQTPAIIHIGMVAPDIIGITIADGSLDPALTQPYAKQPGDVIREYGQQRWIIRDGTAIGGLVGREGTLMCPFDRVVGKRLDAGAGADPAAWRVGQANGPAAAVRRVHRKSKPDGMAQTGEWKFEFPALHTFYLVCTEPLPQGAAYTVRTPFPDIPEMTFRHDPAATRSEAVHVSHAGYRPDEPAKVAYLSCWMGDGGGLTYPQDLPFVVLDDAAGTPVFSGTAVLSKAAADKTEDPYKRNYNGTDVYRMDFSALDRPGRYRVSVPGIGCSYPFPVSREARADAFRVAARGFYHQRSGIELGPPYTDFSRPRCFHPDDGVVVRASTCTLMDSGNGLNARGTDKDNFGNLVKGMTDEVVPNAWGGYFDAGDWDRRIQHLEATRLLLELLELFPESMSAVELNIPESGNRIPDLLDEALWNIDFYGRLQTADGGIRGGIESAEHPRYGECSWHESLTVMAYAPDMWSSFVYAGDAARAVRLLEPRDPDRAARLREGAFAAMAYAEKAFANHDYDKLPHAVPDARNLAAAELFRLTGDDRWHALFLETTVFKDPKADLYLWQSHNQRDAAFVYLRTDRPGRDGNVLANCRNALAREADNAVAQGRRTGFNWTKSDPWVPVAWGVLGAPHVVTLLRAHYLTGDARYLEAALLAAHEPAGANPVNMCYTTGIGPNYPKRPLWLDARRQGVLPPPGLTVFGPFDMEKNGDYWLLKLAKDTLHPEVKEWPTLESYFDITLFPPVTEMTVPQTLGPNTYAWGYFAARP